MSTKRFLGYDTDEEGYLVINRQQAKIVVRIYEEFMSGKRLIILPGYLKLRR